MDKVYLESSFISYLVSKPSTNLIVAAHQRISTEWWEHRRGNFSCFVSETVIGEISEGDPEEVRKRMEFVRDIPVLSATHEVEKLAARFLDLNILPEKAERDAAHIAFATVYGIDYLLTWNCKHLANAQVTRRVRAACVAQGLEVPSICTPEELLGDYDGEQFF